MSNNQSLNNLSPDATIGRIVSAEEKAGELLSSIGLTPGNHQSETLRSVCQQKQWNEVEVLQWLKKNQHHNGQPAPDTKGKQPDFGDNLNGWCHYLEEHFLAKNSALIDEISSNFQRVRKVHGNQYEWLKHVHWHLKRLEEKLNYYFNFQQHKFFPLLEELESSNKNILHGTIKKLHNGIEIIEEDQDEILDLVDTIEEKGEGFENPDGACSTLRILNYKIKQLFSSLRKQIAIEQEHVIPLVKRTLESG